MLTILMKRQVLTLSVLAAALIAGIRRKDLTVPNEDSSFDSAVITLLWHRTVCFAIESAEAEVFHLNKLLYPVV